MVLASTIRLSPGINLFVYVAIWVACAAAVGVLAWAALRSKRWPRWTTQDILIVAALGVLLEVYDNIIGDQFIKPVLSPIPAFEFLQLHDLPYMFLLMVGVALVRKPGCVTAMVFINFLLAALLFGSGHGVLDWTDGLTQGIFCDLYIVARRGAVFGPSAGRLSMVLDGLAIGILRGGPNAMLGDNGLFNGIEGAVSAVLARRVAIAVVPSLGIGKARAASASAAPVDPFAEPAESEPADPVPAEGDRT
jgi:hypothetical protein